MPPLLQGEHLWKLYHTPNEIVVALQDISLTLHEGEWLCLRGPSGSGKSTLLALLGWLDRPTKGVITSYSHLHSPITADTEGIPPRATFGFMIPDIPLIHHLTLGENVALPLLLEGIKKQEARQRAELVLKQMNLAHRIHHLPTQLSTGEEQRGNLARALIMDPAILCIDEPTANLDQKNVDILLSLFRELCRQGTSLVIATHDDRIEAAADRTVHLCDGKIQ